jgi:hypothetical protein
MNDFLTVLFIAICWTTGWLIIADAIREDFDR